jgi:hypothetical protein
MRSWLQHAELGYQSSNRGGTGILDDDNHAPHLNETVQEPHRQAASHSTVRSAAKSHRPQDGVSGDWKSDREQEHSAEPSNRKHNEIAEQMKSKDTLIAFDDKELSAWVMRLGEERSGRFLCALAEAVMKADAEDYSLIRPALLSLKRKHRHGGARIEKTVSPIARRKESTNDSPPQSRGL